MISHARGSSIRGGLAPRTVPFLVAGKPMGAMGAMGARGWGGDPLGTPGTLGTLSVFLGKSGVFKGAK